MTSREAIEFHGTGPMSGVEFEPDAPLPPKPHLFDPCVAHGQYGNARAQHERCHGWYRIRVTRTGRVPANRDDTDAELVVCECPICNHPHP